MLKFLQRKKIPPISMLEGDSLVLIHTDDKGVQRELLQEPIIKSQMINEVATFELRDANGFEWGIGGIFGRSKD